MSRSPLPSLTEHYIDGAVTEDFVQLLLELAGAWDTKLSELRIRVYAKALSGISLHTLQQVFGRMVRECTNFPSVERILAQVKPTGEDAPLVAWSTLDKAAGLAGAWTDVVIEDPVAAAALVRVFGSWPAFCLTDEGPQRALKRQEFLAVYRTLARRVRPEMVPRPVVLHGQLRSLGATRTTFVARVGLDGSVTHERSTGLPGAVERRRLADQS